MYTFSFDISDFTKIEYKKNEIIKNEGDVCNQIGFILSGSINISNINWNNKEFNFQHFNEGDLFREMLIFSKDNHYPGTIYATTNSTILFISKTKFFEKLDSDLAFKNFFFSYTSEKFIQLQTRIKILSQPTIEEKFLYYLKTQFQRNNINRIKIKSLTKLAEYLNVTRPSLSRTINILINENKIQVINKIYSIKNP
jgi:CRP-like cAMP-binding protein